MAKTQTASTLSPFALALGKEIFASDAQAVIEQLNYTYGYAWPTYVSLITSVSGWQTDGDTAVGTHRVLFPASATFATYYRSHAFISADVDEMVWSAEALVGGTETVEARLVINSTNHTLQWAGTSGEQSVTLDTGDSGTGWQPYEIQLRRVSGVLSTNALKSVRFEPSPRTSSLPDPPL